MFGRSDALPVHGGKRADNGVSFSVVNTSVSDLHDAPRGKSNDQCTIVCRLCCRSAGCSFLFLYFITGSGNLLVTRWYEPDIIVTAIAGQTLAKLCRYIHFQL